VLRDISYDVRRFAATVEGSLEENQQLSLLFLLAWPEFAGGLYVFKQTLS